MNLRASGIAISDWCDPLPNPAESRKIEPKKIENVSKTGVNPAVATLYKFGPYCLDANAGILFRDSEPTALGQRAVALLQALVSRPGIPVSKDALIEAAWPGLAIEDSNLTVQIGALRRVLEEETGGQRWIETLSRRGYRYVGPEVAIAEDKGPHIAAVTAASTLALPDKPSIAVLPFQNMSGDSDQEYFADGIAEDILTALSRSRWLFVVARNSSFTYKGKWVDVRQVGRELGVRYVLEGSVRKSGNRVRISAQLISASDGHHVWADRYDRELEDIFAVQDEMTNHITSAIAPGIVIAEAQRTQAKDAAELGTWERLMRAHWHIQRFNPEDFREAVRLLDELLRIDPNNATALSDLAFVLHFSGSFAWADNPASSYARSREAARRAITADDKDPAAHAMAAIDELFSGRHDDAIRRLRRVIELDPNSSFAHGQLSTAYAFGGEAELAIEQAQTAIRLSPRDFLNVIWHVNQAWAHLSAERFQESADCARRAVDWNPAFPDAHGILAAAAAHLGQMADARVSLDAFTKRIPGSLAAQLAARPFRRPADRERYLDGLRKAGLPEQ